MGLDKRATVALRTAEMLIERSRKEYNLKIESEALGPQEPEEKQALADAITSMFKALGMYQQAEGFLIECHEDVEVTLKEMKVQMKQSEKSVRPRLQQGIDQMHGFADHQDEKIQAVQEQMGRMDTQLKEVLEFLPGFAEEASRILGLPPAQGAEEEEQEADELN